jgi:lipopolysaccharide/colanic/teichoic acid biosynthesis glycosyltransferase
VYGLEAVAARCSDVELIQNPEDLDLLRRLHVVPRRKLRLLGNGVDLERFRPDRLSVAERARRRAELGFGDDDVVVGAVGRLVAEKGFPELFAAMERLGPEHRLLVVGGVDPSKPDAIEAATLSRAEERGAVFLGQRDDIEDLYGLMDVFVLASHREGFPRAAMEAAASGLAVVATDIRGCRQVVEDGVTGALVPVGDIEALAAAIASWASASGAAGGLPRQRAEEHFDAAAVDRRVLEAYEPGVAAVARAAAARSVAKRLTDVVGAAAALVLLSPVIAVVAVAVRVLHGRPVLFRQERPGLDGRPFTIAKFRTMRDAYDANGVELPDADRLTRFGRVLRSTSLDELPELVNVLRGEMSLVGPRPLLMEYLDQYTAEERQRHLVRPGITGLAQISGRNATTWEERLALDVEYVRSWSLALDVRILWRTVRTVVSRSGISAEGHDTMPHLDRR